MAGLWTVTRDGCTFLPEGSPKILSAIWSKCLPTPPGGLSWVPNLRIAHCPTTGGNVNTFKELRKPLWGSVYGDSSCESPYQLKGQEACWTKIYNRNNFKWSKDLARWELPLQSFSLKEIIISRWAASDKGCFCSVSSCSLDITVHQLASKTGRFGGSLRENY